MKYNWKFVEVGAGEGKIKFMLCDGNDLVKEFTKKNCPGGMTLEYALMKENTLLEEGAEIKPTIREYILQCNHNAAERDKTKHKKDVVLMSVHDWKRLQKEIEDKKTKS